MTVTNLNANNGASSNGDRGASSNGDRDGVPTTSMRAPRKKQPNTALIVVVVLPLAIASTVFTYALFARIGFVAGVERTCPATAEQCACIVEHLKNNTSWIDNMMMAVDHSLAEEAGRDAARACLDHASHTVDTPSAVDNPFAR